MLYTCRLIYIELYNRVNLIPAIIINCMCAVQDTHNTCMQHACKISQIHACYMYQHACYLVLCACNMLVTCTTFAQSLTPFHSIFMGRHFVRLLLRPKFMHVICANMHVISCSVHVTCMLMHRAGDSHGYIILCYQSACI